MDQTVPIVDESSSICGFMKVRVERIFPKNRETCRKATNVAAINFDELSTNEDSSSNFRFSLKIFEIRCVRSEIVEIFCEFYFVHRPNDSFSSERVQLGDGNKFSFQHEQIVKKNLFRFLWKKILDFSSKFSSVQRSSTIWEMSRSSWKFSVRRKLFNQLSKTKVRWVSFQEKLSFSSQCQNSERFSPVIQTDSSTNFESDNASQVRLLFLLFRIELKNKNETFFSVKSIHSTKLRMFSFGLKSSNFRRVESLFISLLMMKFHSRFYSNYIHRFKRYLPVAIEQANDRSTNGRFVLHQGIQRRISITISHESDTFIQWKDVHEVIVGNF